MSFYTFISNLTITWKVRLYTDSDKAASSVGYSIITILKKQQIQILTKNNSMILCNRCKRYKIIRIIPCCYKSVEKGVTPHLN